jgi:nucleoside-diphosphate-sugar epimerase
MKNVIITGTNGMIGKLVLKNCLSREDVFKVISITRKPIGIQHEKLNEVLHNDFLEYTGLENNFKNIDVCFYCMGVYTGQVPRTAFKKITVRFTKAFAETLRKNNTNTSFCFLSGQGADSSERSKILFAREKGIAENILLNLEFTHTHIFRPGYIYPNTPRKEPNFFYKLMRLLYKPIAAIYPNIGVTSIQLANKMVAAGLDGGDKLIYENKDIRK